jgi:hypothetical protein
MAIGVEGNGDGGVSQESLNQLWVDVPLEQERPLAALSIAQPTHFGTGYSEIARDDHRLFVDAFRNGQIPGLSDR